MTSLLEEAFNRISKLPESEQTKIAKFILDEIENEDTWNKESKTNATTAIRQEPIPRFTEEFDTTPMKTHPISTNEDILYWIQKRNETFPWVNGKRIISEQGASLIHLLDGPPGFNSMLMSDTFLAAPFAFKSLKQFSARSYPQAFLMADRKKNKLYVILMVNDPTNDNLTIVDGRILTMNDIYFTDDIWKYFSLSAQKYLKDLKEEIDLDFGEEKESEEWAELINNYPYSVQFDSEINGEVIPMNLFPIKINVRGSVGTLGSIHEMPEVLINAILQNQLKDAKGKYRMAYIHTHRKINNPTEKVHKALVKEFGLKNVTLSLSVFDVGVSDMTEDEFDSILFKYTNRKKTTTQPYMSVTDLDDNGNAEDIRHYNLNNIADQLELEKTLVDAKGELLKKDEDQNPEPFLKFHEIINDPRVASNKFDPYYRTNQDKAMS